MMFQIDLRTFLKEGVNMVIITIVTLCNLGDSLPHLKEDTQNATT